jgi:hypothetical protein
MLKRFFLYGLPLYLIVVEQFVRSLLHFVPGRPDEMSMAAAGTSVAVAGIALLFPVMIPKPVEARLSARLAKAAGDEQISFTKKSDQRLVSSSIVFLFLLTALWGYGLWLAHMPVDAPWYSLASPLPYGFLNYTIGIIHTELKEIV